MTDANSAEKLQTDQSFQDDTNSDPPTTYEEKNYEKHDGNNASGDVGAGAGLFQGSDTEAQQETSEENILSQYDEEQVMEMGRNFARKNNLDDAELFARGAAVARSPKSFNSMSFLSDDEKAAILREATHPWDIPAKLWQVVFSVSLCAATQGADESVINGAQLYGHS